MSPTASNLKLKSSEAIEVPVPAARTLRKVQKVVKLFPNRRAKTRELTDAEREELVITYRIKARKLARSILRKWHARLDLQEVDSVVDLSLCEAVRRYNPAKGASFMTFLFYHMRGNLIRAVSTAANANTVPMSDYEFSEATACSNAVAAKGINAVEVAEALVSQDFAMPDDQLLKKEMSRISAEACARLDPLEREVIERIYLQEQQLMDIAQSLGYSRCHISRVKKKALETLHGDLAPSFGYDRNARPDFSDEGTTERRRVHRRRPRARHGVRISATGTELHVAS